MFKYLFIYLAIVNIIAVLINCIDKIKAKQGAWRIPEATLWFFGIIGGATGSFVTMKIIHHKTRHKKFMILMPILMILQITAIVFIATTGRI